MGFKSKFAEPGIGFFAAISAFILVSLSQAGRIIAVAGTEYRMRSPRIWGYGWLVFSSFRCYQCMVMAAGALVTKKHPRLFTAALYVYILGRYLLEAHFALFEHSSNQSRNWVAPGYPMSHNRA